MLRRALLVLLPLALAACGSEAPPPAPPADTVTPALEALASRAEPGQLGAAVLDLGTGEMKGVNADKPMPMQSVFKLPLAIVVLDLADKGKLSLDEEVTLTRDQLSVAHSPIADAFPEKTDYTIEALMRAAVAQSDNSAADILLKRIGGPEVVTRFFQDRGIGSFRLDRYEYELQPQLVGLPEFSGQWIGMDAFSKAQATVPVETQRASLRIYLADPRDRVSPADVVRILSMLAKGELLSPESTEKLMDILESTSTGTDRLKAGVPDGATVYHKTGTGPTVDGIASATNDVGIIELADGRRLAVAAFLAGAELPPEGRAALIAEVARIATGDTAEAP
ncbi:class A beta-lactamase [Sphingosinicella humi]|uniref:beta-lactamase n=1 Tax=Allosphingosinicella humi TaxID=2068657 RepID=A0A2U2J5F6_9SPHN|nr:class A beta-lactamase [Sphingosinicella humi]PWG03573.1 serine hydrolase [Sphingosinicella humi]